METLKTYIKTKDINNLDEKEINALNVIFESSKSWFSFFSSYNTKDYSKCIITTEDGKHITHM